MRFAYADNEEGDPMHANNGFHIQPLDPALYGSRAARESRARKAKKKGLTINVSSRNHVGHIRFQRELLPREPTSWSKRTERLQVPKWLCES